MRNLTITLTFLAGLVLGASACTSPNTAREILEAEGYTNIEITGYKPFACSDDDDLHTGFRARGVNGRLVEGTVCCGLFAKDCTTRVSHVR